MIWIATIISCIALLYSAHRLYRRDLSAAPILAVSMTIIVAVLAANEIVYSPFALVWSNLGAINNAEQSISYLLFIEVLYLCVHLAMRPNKVSAAQNWSHFNQALHSARAGTTLTGAAIVGVTILAVAHFVILNKSGIWFNQVYLYMASSDALEIRNGLSSFLQSSYKIIGLLSFIGLAFLAYWRRHLSFVVLLIPSIWFLLFEVAGHSRYGAVFLVAFSITAFVLSSTSGLRLLAIVAGAGATPLYAAALQGRNSGAHGFSTLPNVFEQASSLADGQFLIRVVTNLFEGVFSVAESFYFTNIALPEPYKYLSFSPLPSFIDGFAANWQNKSVFLDTYVPMGALGELLLFGPGYMIVYFLTVALAYALTTRALGLGRYVTGNLTALILTMATFLQFTYSVRTSYRFFLICIVAYLLTAIVDHRGKVALRRQSRGLQTPVAGTRATEMAKIGQ